MNRSVLLTCQQMAESADRLVMNSGTLHWRCSGSKMIDWKSFRDGFPDIMIRDVEKLIGKDVTFLASFENKEDIFAQMGVICALPRYRVNSLKVILPYFPTGTMERVDTEGQVATAMSLARILSVIPLTRRGPAEIYIFDIHSLPERFFFGDLVIPCLETAIPLLKQRIERILIPTGKKAIVFPDEGAYKRFGRYFQEWDIICCEKKRKGDKREVRIASGNPRGKHCIIVDDLIMTGGTQIACLRALFQKKARWVSAYATHGVMPEDAWRNLQKEPFSKIWITDSCPNTVAKIKGQRPSEVISLLPVINRIIENY